MFEYYFLAFKNYINFEGKATQKEFWYFQLVNFLVILAFVILSFGISSYFAVLYWLYSMAIVVPNISLFVRRLHDIGKSGWYWLLLLIPVANVVVWLIVGLTKSKTTEIGNEADKQG